MTGKKFALVAPSARSALKLRDGLIRSAVERGHEVLCVAPDAGSEIAKFSTLGCRARSLDMHPPGLAFFADRKAISELAAVLREFGADAVLGYGGRPLLLAAQAARRSGVKRIVGLINSLTSNGASIAGEDIIPARGYAIALKACDVALAHNQDHLRSLKSIGALRDGLKAMVVPGAGVDLTRYAPQPLPAIDQGLTFLMIARLARSRGVEEYVAAARAIKARAPGARFLLAGPAGTGADAVSLEAAGVIDGAIEYLGDLDDVRPALGRAHVLVHPSHNEGMPRQVLEAMAAGRPIITSNIAGCRETVDERVNGCLVPPGDAEGLVSAMESFLKRPDLIPAMARASRSKAERCFDLREVNRVVLDALGL